MAVSGNTQRGFYGDCADKMILADDLEHANTLVAESKLRPEVRKAVITKANVGSRQKPYFSYTVRIWFTQEHRSAAKWAAFRARTGA